MKLAEPLTVWRLVSARRARHAFDGEGARLYGGRWNHPGVPVVYTSATLSLAALELFVHLQPDTVPDDLVSIAATLPAKIEIEPLDRGALPEDWRRYPGSEELKELGTAWQRAGRTPVLEVPSAAIPQESNYLLNPAHPDLRRLEIGEPRPFSYDPRMWRRDGGDGGSGGTRSRPAAGARRRPRLRRGGEAPAVDEPGQLRGVAG